MKKIAQGCVILAVAALMCAVVTKLTGKIFNIGPDGFLDGSMVLLLFGANLTLLEILEKK